MEARPNLLIPHGMFSRLLKGERATRPCTTFHHGERSPPSVVSLRHVCETLALSPHLNHIIQRARHVCQAGVCIGSGESRAFAYARRIGRLRRRAAAPRLTNGAAVWEQFACNGMNAAVPCIMSSIYPLLNLGKCRITTSASSCAMC